MQKLNKPKPEPRTVTQYDWFEVRDWMLQEKLWTDAEEDLVWFEVCDFEMLNNDSICTPGGLIDCYLDDEKESNQKKAAELLVKMFEALGEKDYYVNFWVSW